MTENKTASLKLMAETLIDMLAKLGPDDKKAVELIAQLKLTPTNQGVLNEAIAYCPSSKFVKDAD